MSQPRPPYTKASGEETAGSKAGHPVLVLADLDPASVLIHSVISGKSCVPLTLVSSSGERTDVVPKDSFSRNARGVDGRSLVNVCSSAEDAKNLQKAWFKERQEFRSSKPDTSYPAQQTRLLMSYLLVTSLSRDESQQLSTPNWNEHHIVYLPSQLISLSNFSQTSWEGILPPPITLHLRFSFTAHDPTVFRP